MADVLNANPTIRNPSDLPTRRRHSSPKPDEHIPGLFSSTVPSYAYTRDPFEPSASESEREDDSVEEIDEQEIFDLISTISDPEHPLSLGSLSVVNLSDIYIRPLTPALSTVLVEITPTITHCSLATVIGLGVRVRLENALPPRFRVDVKIKEGTHSTGEQVNKQLGDKERVAAALENAQLMRVLRKMLETCQ
ncbi:hypothetical protein MMC09_004962 [Bachmanniomyces sp. S44760]|nr:hypothetical protein [Bachmanniomyces sp. S44760]